MNFKKTGILLLVFLALLEFGIFAEGQQEATGSAGEQYSCEDVETDGTAGTGASIKSGNVSAEVDLRIVSLAPNITEIVFALGRGDCLVGRTDYCNYPEEAALVQSVGSIMEPNTETIIGLNPDLVIASTHGPKEIGEMLNAAGLNVKYYYAPTSFEGVFEMITQLGADLCAVDKAGEIVSDMRGRYEKLKKNAAGITERPSVYYVIGFGEGGDWTAGGDTFIGQMIDIAGGNNIAADISGWSYSLEKIVETDPDIIVIGQNFKDTFIKTPIYSDLSAVKNDRVYGVDEDVINRQGPRLIEGIELLNAAFSE